METKELKTICKELKENFLFQASLGSKELFHSNMLAWLLEQPNENGEYEALSIFLKLVLKRPHSHTNLIELAEIKREEKKIDLTILWKEEGILKCIFIENKMKSIPTTEQLKKYNETINKKIKDSNNISKLILTPFESPEKGEFEAIDWFNVSYEKHIIPFLEKCKKINFYTNKREDEKRRLRITMLVDLYLELLDNTLKVFQSLKINHEKEFLNSSYHKFYQSGPEMELIKEIRIDDLVLKIIHEKIASIVKNKISELDTENIKKIEFSAGYFRTEGITDLKISIHQKKGLCHQYIILQLQGLTLRYGTEVIFEKKNKNTQYTDDAVKEEISRNIAFAKNLYEKKIWFFEDRNIKTLLKGNGRSVDLKIEHSGKNSFHSFSNNSFVCMNLNLTKFENVSEIVELIFKETAYVIQEISHGKGKSNIIDSYHEC